MSLSKNFKRFKYNSLAIALALASNYSIAGEESEEEEEAEGTVLQVIGSRNQKVRTIVESPVPIDIISSDDLQKLGSSADLTDNLRAAIPSYSALPATGDGSAFVRPTSLRGTAPDQTLILVNGKRRHRSALVQFFAPAAGNGAHGADIGLIPSIALERVEVLRDGAASQYGSDAIAGVINFVTKKQNNGGEFEVKYGEYFQGEQSIYYGINKGLEFFGDGFLNVSFESTDNQAFSRGIQSTNGEILIDYFDVLGVGEDSPFGDAPLTNSWGRPQTLSKRAYISSGFSVSEESDFYANLGYAESDGRYRFFYRSPVGANGRHSSLQSLYDQGYQGDLLFTGYTPYLDGTQKDISFVTGFKGTVGETFYDFSYGFGQNKLDYFLNNTINPGLGMNWLGQIPQRDFDVGGYEQKEVNYNIDFSTPVGDSLNVAYGAEYREETYTANQGEPNSYLNADGTPGSGSNGLRGVSPEDAGSFTRDNYAVYVDVEHDFTSDFMVQYAGRYEEFSDFGDTTNWKVASRYSLDQVTLRGAVSTGFHAPTPGQANVRTTLTTIDDEGVLYDTGLISSTDPRAQEVGGVELTEEKSFNTSLGLTWEMDSGSSLSIDLYKIEVDGRIYRTDEIEALDGGVISFYTNALDVEHTGADLIYTTEKQWSEDISTDFTLSYSYNIIDVVDQKTIIGQDGIPITPVEEKLVEDIENNYPTERFILSTNTNLTDDLNFMLRANYYGSHYDENGRINGVDGELPSAKISDTIYLDCELAYHVDDNLVIKFGLNNLLDNYVDEIGPENSNYLSAGLQYPRRSAANYEGGSWYLGATYSL